MPPPDRITLPSSLVEVFARWGNEWIWEDLRLDGDADWLEESIQAGDCIAVADGLYMPDLHTDLCSMAFFFKCKQGWGRLVGSFADRGELLGIMTIHLILLGISRRIRIYSDCKGALDRSLRTAQKKMLLERSRRKWN